MESENVTLTAVTEDKPQIVGAFPQIIVTGTADEPYYKIMYSELADGKIYVGYSSYDLDCVFWFLKEYFGETQARAVDPESLRPKGRWVYDEGNLGWACSECLCAAHVSFGAISGYILSGFCPNCGAKMEG